MTTRREILFSAGGGVVGGVGAYIGLSVLSTGYADIEWANNRDEEVWIETTVTSNDSFFSSSEVEYQTKYRVFPTQHARGGDLNVVETGTYDVEVEIESKDGSQSAGPFQTRWTPADCYHQRLIIEVLDDMSVEFLQKEC
ncbi:hypothetical protein ACAH01_15310 [Halomicrobium sp. HM KBTZ05]|uniref:hypothetical protein n=1 Tax=Halomicrobium sp. HM KBTZ05 TaxID=3242663 RepID=UPI003556B1F6